MRVADYIAEFIHRQGVSDIFMVTGGGMIFLSDAIAQHPSLKAVCHHHEQAAAMAAATYAKLRGLGVCYVTTGCGGTNAVTGLLGAWQDSVPCLFISGQCKRRQTIRNSGLRLRQFGVQECDIIEVVQSLTKYAVMVNDPNDIAYHLERAVWLMRTGRPGPAWLDVPLDVQAATVDEIALRRFDPASETGLRIETPNPEKINVLTTILREARRPVVIVGQGVRLAGACVEFRRFVERLPIPFVASRLGIDIMPSDHPLYIGRIGNKGDRAGNLAVQNADLVLSIGSRLSVSSVGYDPRQFARAAKVVVVDIDPVEHQKGTVRIDLLIDSDAREFLLATDALQTGDTTEWVRHCQVWRERYPVCLPEYENETAGVNPYTFIDRLSKAAPDDAVFVADAGSAFYIASQAVKIRGTQRYVTSGAQAEMGYSLPAAIGASFAGMPRNLVIAMTGDGSLQMNIQELQTLVHHHLPVKLFVLNNGGYRSISATQELLCDGRYFGTAAGTGVSFPSTRKIAAAYGLPFWRVATLAELDGTLSEVLAQSGPAVCEVMLPHNHTIAPQSMTVQQADGSLKSLPLEDMAPLLDRAEFNANMEVSGSQ
jgi:acetolactate synthase-1/2/3 large subunit